MMFPGKENGSGWVSFASKEFFLAALFFITVSSSGRPSESPPRLAVLNLGESQTGRLAAEKIARSLASPFDPSDELRIVDREQAEAAAKGIGYRGSLNLTIEEARDLGAAIGCDFYLLGDAQTVKRSPSTGASYFESFASVFLVSARTGRLVLWERPIVQRDSPEESLNALLSVLSSAETHQRYRQAMHRVLDDERAARAATAATNAPIIEVMSDENSEGSKNIQAPRAYRRLKPPYPEPAARAEVEATVDVLVDIDVRGEVGRIEIARWAGYGLDQSVLDTVKQMHFFPAIRDGVAIPMRVLLRYNFRKPPIENSAPQKPLFRTRILNFALVERGFMPTF